MEHKKTLYLSMDVYNRLAGVGVKGSTNKLSFSLHFHARLSDAVVPLFQDKK